MSGKRVLAEGKYLRLIDDNSWEYVERRVGTNVVGVMAKTNDEKIVLVEQYRASMHAQVIELPSGLVGDEDDHNESILKAAERELLEETGYAAREFRKVIEGPSSTGLTNEVVNFIMATGLEKKNGGGGVGNEKITVHEVPIAEADAWLRKKSESGLCIDPRVYIGLYFLKSQQ
ncbi:NUDIX hydrolase [bacterium]|nr:NUDIX hydrolase [bacterium]